MDKEKAESIIKIVNWVRFIIFEKFLAFVFVGLSKTKTTYKFDLWRSAGTEKKFNSDLDYASVSSVARQ